MSGLVGKSGCGGISDRESGARRTSVDVEDIAAAQSKRADASFVKLLSSVGYEIDDREMAR